MEGMPKAGDFKIEYDIEENFSKGSFNVIAYVAEYYIKEGDDVIPPPKIGYVTVGEPILSTREVAHFVDIVSPPGWLERKLTKHKSVDDKIEESLEEMKIVVAGYLREYKTDRNRIKTLKEKLGVGDRFTYIDSN